MKKRMAKKLAKRQAERAVAAKLEKIFEERENLKLEAQENLKKQESTVKQAEAKVSAPTKAESSGKKTNIFYQFGGQQIEQQEIIGLIKNEWKAQGNMMKDLKSLEVYLKPEEHTAYYVINDQIKGSITVG